MTEVLVHSACMVLTDKCGYVEPIRHDGEFDVYDLSVGKHYWVGCGKMTYKILVYDKGFDIVEISLESIDYYCKEVVVNEPD